MSSANMEHLPKYEEVSECCDALEELDLSLVNEIADVNEIEDKISELEELSGALENISFPGMY